MKRFYYRILDPERGQYWRQDQQGYTANAANAGLWTLTEIEEQTAFAGSGHRLIEIEATPEQVEAHDYREFLGRKVAIARKQMAAGEYVTQEEVDVESKRDEAELMKAASDDNTAMTGVALRAHRQRLGMTQPQLAAALGFGERHIRAMERDEYPIEKRTAMAVLYLLGATQ